MQHRRLSVLATVVIIAIGWTSVSAFCQTTFEGKTIRIVVSSTAAGPVDLLARQFAPFIAKYVSGKPTVIVENRPGAGGMLGANYIYNLAKPDGLVVGFLFGVVTQGLIGGDNIRFDPAKFHWLGAVSQTQVLLARKDLNISAPRDLLKPAKPLVLASPGVNSTADMGNRLFLDMIGASYKLVTGYPGQPETMMALGRGEVSLGNSGHSLYLSRRQTIRQEGLYDAIVQRGELNPDGTFRRNRLIAEIPTMVEAITELKPASLQSADFATYRSIVGAFTVHFGLMLPPATDTAIVRTLRKAISDALNDPEARKVVGDMLKTDYDFVDGESAERVVERVRSEYYGDTRIAERLKGLMTSK